MHLSSCSVRRFAVVATTVALTAPLAGVSASAAGQVAAPPPVPTLAWAPCEEGETLECTTATVPLDYDDPDGATIELALARVPASDPANRIGTLFLNPGGPGGSGVQFVAGVGEYLDARLQGRFDIVGFDPRGVAGSNPLYCFRTADELNEFFADQPLFPYREEQERPFYDRYTSLARACFDGGLPIAQHMSTADVARDMDLLREAVGDDQISYLGFSYGSYLGTTYTELFPDHIRALVIDGVLDPKLWSQGWQIRADRRDTAKEFNQFLILCDRAGDDCAFSGPDGARARWAALARAVGREPIDLGFPYSYDFLIADATGAMYAPEVWGGPEGFATFLDLLSDTIGDPSTASDAADVRTRLLERLRPAQEAYSNGLDAYFGNHCADTQYRRWFVGWRDIGDYARRGSRFGPYWWWFNNGCAAWPLNGDRFAGPWTVRTSAPVLVVGNFYDGVTGYDGAVSTSKLLVGSRLLSYAGWGHTAYGRNECTTAYIDAYLLDGALPARGTVCAANPNPHLASTARAAAADDLLIGLPPPWLHRD